MSAGIGDRVTRARAAWARVDEGRRADVLLVGALVALSLLPFAGVPYRFRVDVGAPRAAQPSAAVLVGALAQALPLLLRRRYPLAVLVAVAGAFVAVQALGLFPVAADLAVFCAPYALTAYGRPLTWWALVPYALGPVAVLMVLVPPVRAHLNATDLTAAVAVFAAAPGVTGLAVRRRREARQETVARLLATARPPVPAPAPSGPTGPVAALAPRERDVLGGVMRGLSNAEIGRELSLSPETVKTYVSRILRKLDVPDRTAAAVLAERHGLGRDEPAAPG